MSRKSAGGDLANVQIIVLGLEAKKWILIFILLEVLEGLINLSHFIYRYNSEARGSTGLINLLWILLYIFCLWCQSKTCFTCFAILPTFLSTLDIYVFSINTLVLYESHQGYKNDEFLRTFFSFIKIPCSLIVTYVIFRLSWCNGLEDQYDVEKNVIMKCIQEQGIFKCVKCEEKEQNEFDFDTILMSNKAEQDDPGIH